MLLFQLVRGEVLVNLKCPSFGLPPQHGARQIQTSSAPNAQKHVFCLGRYALRGHLTI